MFLCYLNFFGNSCSHISSMAHVQVDNTIAGCFFVDERKNFCFFRSSSDSVCCLLTIISTLQNVRILCTLIFERVL